MKQTRAMTDREYVALKPEMEEFSYLAEQMQELQGRIARIIAAIDANIVGYDPERMTVTIELPDIEE